jgi:hypothetical protein
MKVTLIANLSVNGKVLSADPPIIKCHRKLWKFLCKDLAKQEILL